MAVSARAIREIKSRLPLLDIKTDEPMRRHCSFRIGGPAAAVIFPKSQKELTDVCVLLKDIGISPFIIGNGTNLLITDGRLDRVIIKTGKGISDINKNGPASLIAGCGVTLAELADTALESGLSGLEFAAGMPGTLGGAVVMNAGAYGGEMKDIVKRTYFLDEELNYCEAVAGEHGFSYRRSVFSDSDKIIVKCDIELTPEDREIIRAAMRVNAEQRRLSQPTDKPSAGSVFKRPENGYAAALIDEAGLKGFVSGGARVSEKHAGFIVNSGGASFDDVIKLMEHIQKTVFKNTGINLEPEIKILR